MAYPASLRKDLSEIQRRLRRKAAQNDRMHERLALKIHREAVVQETASEDDGGELDAGDQASLRRPGH